MVLIPACSLSSIMEYLSSLQKFGVLVMVFLVTV
jgi:hypothetical protein